MNSAQLNEYKARFRAWWTTLAEREQRALLVASAVVGIFILYAGIWSPIVSHLDYMRKQIKTQQNTLAWMKTADKEIQKFAGQKPQETKAMTSLMLISVLQKQIKHAGLEPNLVGLKQASDDAVEMHFQKVEFDKLISMLTAVVKEYHINIVQMSATAEAPGVVNADVVVRN